MTETRIVYVWELSQSSFDEESMIREALVARETQNYWFLTYPRRGSVRKVYRKNVVVKNTLQEMIDWVRSQRDRELSGARNHVKQLEKLKTVRLAAMSGLATVQLDKGAADGAGSGAASPFTDNPDDPTVPLVDMTQVHFVANEPEFPKARAAALASGRALFVTLHDKEPGLQNILFWTGPAAGWPFRTGGIWDVAEQRFKVDPNDPDDVRDAAYEASRDAKPSDPAVNDLI